MGVVEAMKWKQATPSNFPVEWELSFNDEGASLSIAVHRIAHMDGWYVSCHYLRMFCVPIASPDLEVAKRDGVQAVLRVAELRLQQVKNLLLVTEKR